MEKRGKGKHFVKKTRMNKKFNVPDHDMGAILSDDRFSNIVSDPKMRHMARDDHKVKLDSRFSSVLTDSRFHEKSTMDPRGRRGNFSTKEDLRRFYRLSSDEESDESEIDVEESNAEDGHLQCQDETLDQEVIDKGIAERLKDLTHDYARGDLFFSEDSSDDDSTTSEEDDEENLEEFDWAEVDKDAIWDTEENKVEETRRIAVCNMDWDRISASDILVLVSSFLPRGGTVLKVIVYPSEYGKLRLAEEELTGPQELVELKGENVKGTSRRKESQWKDEIRDLERLEKGRLQKSDGSSTRQMEALRRYQRNRLRYYYAVVECDCVETAQAIYRECDRHPFEGAGVLMDLRYIPDGMTFDETPHDVATSLPSAYQVKTFTTSALRDGRPTLTWDETNPDRTKALSTAMMKSMKGEKVDEENLKAYLASSSENESDLESDSSSGEEDDRTSRLNKYRSLLMEIEAKEKQKKETSEGFDMEEHFDLKEDTKEEAKEDTPQEKLTPFEAYLEKRKSRKKDWKGMKEQAKLKDFTKQITKKEDDIVEMSDDELPDDDIFSDPFFAEEIKKTKKKPKGRKLDEVEQNGEDDEEQSGNLELLMMPEQEETKNHFHMNAIVQKGKKANTKNKKVKKPVNTEDARGDSDFQIDLVDPRFASLTSSADYNVDPSHPQFKSTKAMDAMMQTMQKKRMAESFDSLPQSKKSSTSNAIDDLVHKVKFQTKKVKKQKSFVS